MPLPAPVMMTVCLDLRVSITVLLCVFDDWNCKVDNEYRPMHNRNALYDTPEYQTGGFESADHAQRPFGGAKCHPGGGPVGPDAVRREPNAWAAAPCLQRPVVRAHEPWTYANSLHVRAGGSVGSACGGPRNHAVGASEIRSGNGTPSFSDRRYRLRPGGATRAAVKTIGDRRANDRFRNTSGVGGSRT